ncbi:MAG TPA: phosphoribosylanthranilate isomerase [Chitinophagaceae bacterium]|jgi:phosphoribosylanthranilate isomerase|nr:phosphoribosylanthranilate isomerase [Chitinophagaceae bacterium]
MKIKVCGITRLEQLQSLENSGVDFAGMIFYEGSKRFVGEKLTNDKAEVKKLKIQKVGVFVNEEVEKIEELVAGYGLDYVQLHGDESVLFCKEVEAFVPVIKAIRIGPAKNIGGELDAFKDACSYILFDTDSKGYGGTGQRFDWSILKDTRMRQPFFLSGGIGPDDVAELKGFDHPHLFAVDINSRFEVEPGVKDLDKVNEFIDKMHSH